MRWAQAVLSAFTLIAISFVASAEGWPRWLGPDGTGISTEKGLAESWPEAGLKQLWSHTVGIGYASPIAQDGKVYLFSQEDTKDILRCFDAESGNVVWAQSYDRGKDPDYPGTRASPTIDGTRIYTHGSDGDLVCRELADGKLVWHINILKETSSKPIEWGQSCSPLVTDGLVYVQAGVDGDATAVAVDKNTGKITWKSEAKTFAGYATSILAEVAGEKQLIVFAGDRVYGMDPKSGKTLWSEPWKTDYDVNAATPVYHNSKLLISSTRKNGVMMLSLTPQGANKEWEKPSISCKFQPPILDDGVVYANSGGTLRCISWPDGEILWSAKGREMNLGNGGSIVRVGDKLITMSERGKLSLVLANPKEYKLISQVALFDYDKVWATPLIYRGKLYAKGKDELVCLDISAVTP